MPRAKASYASPTFMAHPHTLSKRAQDALREALDIDTFAEHGGDRAMLNEVERALGAYPAFVRHVEHAPRLGAFRDTLRPLGNRALALANDVGNLNGYMFDALQRELLATGADVYAMENALAALHAAAYRAVEAQRQSEERAPAKTGRPRAMAMEYVIGELCTIYARHARTQQQPRAQRGSVGALSEWEAERVAFVKAALKDAAIPAPRELPALIRRLVKSTATKREP